ncbi:putative multidrug transporter membrane\ATP-binding components [Tyzzerella nexilis]|uniref:Putative multidrug transporter membrane\ATP-binding components n=1 Tax=[Clostridium] nexile TaxID=29361 RepID=A0A6N2VWF4_9FIRM
MVKYIFYLRDVFLMNRKRVIFVLMLSIATLILSIIQPAVIQQLMDQGILKQNIQKLGLLFGLLILVAFIQCILKYIMAIIHIKIKKEYSYYIKIKIFNHISNLSGSFFSDKKTGELVKVLENDIYTIENAGIDLIIDVIFNVITSIWAILILCSINFQLLFVVLFIELIIIITQQYFIKHMYKKVEELRCVSGRSMNFTEEFLSNILNLILVKADKIFMRKFREIEKINITKTVEYMRFSEGV